MAVVALVVVVVVVVVAERGAVAPQAVVGRLLEGGGTAVEADDEMVEIGRAHV